MADKSIEKELINLETKYWQSMKTKDFETGLSLVDDPCLIVGPNGVASIDKEKFRRMMQSAPYSLTDFDLEDMRVRVLADDFAVLAYKVHEKLTVEGKPLTVDAAHSSTWTKRDGRWVCALHSESIEGDPFGRDRKAA